jgi:hypothetical protein
VKVSIIIVLCVAALLDLNGTVNTESAGKSNGFIRLKLKGADTCGHSA